MLARSWSFQHSSMYRRTTASFSSADILTPFFISFLLVFDARPACVDRDLVFQVLQLFGGGGTAQNGVSMRVAPEACYHVAVSPGLPERELVHRLEVGRREFHLLLGAANSQIHPLQVVGAFRVAEGQHEKQTLGDFHVAVHPGLDALSSEPRGGGVLSVGQRLALVDAAGELVEDDDEREPTARRLCPRVELAPTRPLQHTAEPLGDLPL